MREAIARLLRRIADRIFHDPREVVEVVDEYNICRWRVMVDAEAEAIEVGVVELPAGWRFEEYEE